MQNILVGAFVSAITILSVLAMPPPAHGQGLPTDEVTDDIMKLCAVGRQIGVEGDVRAGLQRWFSEAKASGAARIEDLGAILMRIRPDNVGVEFYRLYTDCVEKQARIKAGQLGIITGSWRDIIKDLSSMANGDYDLQTRLSAIYAIPSLANDARSETFYTNATRVLVNYIETNITDRKRKGPGIVCDRGTYKAQDIIAAFKVLQQLQKASSNTIEIALIGIDFTWINFVETGGLDLSRFKFHYSHFDNAFLSACICRYTEFNFATFNGAAIWNADFTGARFHKANLKNSKWTNVEFSGSNIDEALDHRVALMASPKGLTRHQQSLFPDRRLPTSAGGRC
jgi:hypothetical protein